MSTEPFVDPLASAAWHALRHFAHLDEANAAIHTAPVRYSPITFRLAQALAPWADAVGVPWANAFGADPTIARVLADVGKYAEDRGRA